MTDFPFGRSPADPPAPSPTAPPSELAAARAVSPAADDPRVEAAWHVLCDRDADDAALRAACRTLLARCRDGRRKPAAELLRLLAGAPNDRPG